MAIQVIIMQAGPLPITQSFSAPGDELMYLEVNGSVWSQTANTLLEIDVALDGQLVGAAQVFSNGSSTHRPVLPAYIAVELSEGNHTLTLSCSGTTVSDNNDLYTAVLH